MSDKIYCGSGKSINSQYGEFHSITIDLEALYKASKEGFGFESQTSGKKYIKLNLNKRQSEGKYGETHSLTVDTWKPDSNANSHSNGDNGTVQNNVTNQSSSNTGQVKKVFQDDIPGKNTEDIPF